MTDDQFQTLIGLQMAQLACLDGILSQLHAMAAQQKAAVTDYSPRGIAKVMQFAKSVTESQLPAASLGQQP